MVCGSPKLPSHFLGEDRRDYARAGALCFSSCTSFVVVSHRRKEAEAKRVKEGAGQQHKGEKDITGGRNFRGTRRDGYRCSKKRRGEKAKFRGKAARWKGVVVGRRKEIGKYETQERGLREKQVRKRKYRHVGGSERDTSFFSDEKRKRERGGDEGERDTQGMESRKANLTFISGILGFAL